MPKRNPDIKKLVNEFAPPGLIDKINDPAQKERLNELSEDDQKALAQDIVIEWIEKDFDPSELNSIRRMRGETGFNSFLVQAAGLFAAYNGFCDGRNPHPEQMIEELRQTVDALNDMPDLKACLIKDVLEPNVDNVVAKIDNKSDRNELSKVFQSEKLIFEKINGANEAADLVTILKGETPWQLFNERGFSSDFFVEHAELVDAMVSQDEANQIGKRFLDTPKELKSLVSKKLHSLDEAFKGLNRMHASETVFSIMNRSFSTSEETVEPKAPEVGSEQPSIDEVRKAAGHLRQNSMFVCSDSSSSDPGPTGSQYNI